MFFQAPLPAERYSWDGSELLVPTVQEILHRVEGFVPRSPIVVASRDIFNGDWLKHHMRTLKKQVDEL